MVENLTMFATLQLVLDKLQALSLREKGLVGVTGAAILIFTLQLSLIQPMTARVSEVKQQINVAEALNRGLANQLKNSPTNRVEGEKLALAKEIKIVEMQLQAVEAELEKYTASMVSANEMPSLLQILLKQQGLQLMSLNNIAPVAIMNKVQGADETFSEQPSGLYRHGINLQLRGNYSEVQGYLEKLEQQTGKLLWRSMSYEVEQYPTGSLSLELQTLSMEERWLGV